MDIINVLLSFLSLFFGGTSVALYRWNRKLKKVEVRTTEFDFLQKRIVILEAQYSDLLKKYNDLINSNLQKTQEIYQLKEEILKLKK